MDDTLIYTMRSREEQQEKVETVLAKLEAGDARLKMSKVELAREEVCFLGLLLNNKGWRLHSKLLEAVESAPVPTTRHSRR